MIIKLCNTLFYYISFILYVCVVFHMYPINPDEYLYTCTPFRSFQGTFDNMFFPRVISHTRHTGAYLWSVDAQGEWSIVSREVQLLGFLFWHQGVIKILGADFK